MHLLHTEHEQNLPFSTTSDLKSSKTEQKKTEHGNEGRDGIIHNSIQAHIVEGYEWSISAASALLMEASITCPLIFHSHTGGVNLTCNRYKDTQASCVITRGTMSAQFPVPLHSSGFQLTWADPHANHTWLLSTSPMERIMLLGWCSSQQEGRLPLEPPLTGMSVVVIYHILSGQQGAKRDCAPLNTHPPFLLPSEYLWLEQWCWGLLRDEEALRWSRSVLGQTRCLCWSVKTVLNWHHPLFPITILSLCTFFTGLYWTVYKTN